MADKQEFLNYYNLLDQKLKKMVGADNKHGMIPVFASTIPNDMIRETLLSIVNFRNNVLAHGILPVGFTEVDDSYIEFLKEELAFVNDHYYLVKNKMLQRINANSDRPNKPREAGHKHFENRDPDIAHFIKYRKDYCDWGDEFPYCIREFDNDSPFLQRCICYIHSVILVFRPTKFTIQLEVGKIVTRDGVRIAPLYIDGNLSPFQKATIRFKAKNVAPIPEVHLGNGEQKEVRKLRLLNAEDDACHFDVEFITYDERYGMEDIVDKDCGF